MLFLFFFSSRRRHTRCALVTGVQTCALPISAVEAAVALTPRIANEKKGASAPFFSGDARWATVGAHLGAMALPVMPIAPRSEEHTSELQSLMRISYAVFCLKKKTKKKRN